MKSTLLKTLIIAGLSIGLQLFLPWWIIVVTAFGVELSLGGKTQLSFFSGFYGIFIYWLIYAGIIDFQTDFILSKKIAILFKLPDIPLLMVLVTAMIGGTVGGMGSLTGNLFRKIFIS